MKVYVIQGWMEEPFNFDGPDYNVIAIFSSEKLARDYIASITETCYDEIYIFEHTLDEPKHQREICTVTVSQNYDNTTDNFSYTFTFIEPQEDAN